MSSNSERIRPPGLGQIEAAAEQLSGRVLRTPLHPWPALAAAGRFEHEGEVILKLECLQHTGSFKARAALLGALGMDREARQRGVTAVSAGNHAAATAFAASSVGSTAKVVMPKNANPYRIAACQRWGAEVVLVDNVHQAFEEVARIEQEEGRLFLHPFEGERVALGTGSLGLEFIRQADQLDAVVIPIGGGGLCAGMACAIKQVNPDCRVIGVEPRGADTMHRSFSSGKPGSIDQVRTIADSLGAPHAAPYSFALCRQFVDELVLIDDQDMLRAMAVLAEDVKLAVEPAGAASTAALQGPLRGRLQGRVGLIVCGANIDAPSYQQFLARGLEAGGPDQA